MKNLLCLFLVLVLSTFVFAQKVKIVPAADKDGNPIINALITYVVADTSADGKQLNDVYKLELGKTYFYNQSPVFKNPITLIADKPGTTDATKPPKLILALDDKGEAPYEHCITTFANLTVKNIAFSTTTVEGNYSWANAILLQSDGLTINLEGCIFELTGWGMIEANVNNSKFFINKCHVRNGTVYDYGDEWCPFFLEINAGSAESLIIRNSTFFNLQGSVINIETQNLIKYLEVDHNTFVNVVKGFSTAVHAHINSKITNNIFYNVGTHSFTLAEIQSSDDKLNDGVVTVDTLSSNKPGSTLPFVIAEKDRKFILKSNMFFFSRGVEEYWSRFSSEIAKREFLDLRAKTMFKDKVNYPKFVEENYMAIDPGFKKFGGTDDMVKQLIEHRANGTFGFFGWDYDGEPKEYHWAFLEWPMPEDFSYSISIKGTDGLSIGSLVYYPDELVKYETVVGIEKEDTTIPSEFELAQNYPNPFNPSTTIEFSIKFLGNYSLKIFNILGEQVATIADQQFTPGSYKINWDASKLSSGMYFYQLNGKNVNITKKMILMK